MIAAWTDSAVLVMWLAIIVVGVGLSALYSGMETGVYMLNKIRLELRGEAGSRRAKLLQRMMRRPNNLLAVLLIGTNLSSYAVTFAFSAMFLHLCGGDGRSEWYTLVAATTVLFIFGDTVPKNIFRLQAEKLVYRLAFGLNVSSKVFNACGIAPLVKGAASLMMRGASTRSEGHQPLGHDGLAAVVAEGAASGALTHFQSVMADRVMHIGEITLTDVMIPLAEVVSAPQDVTVDQVKDIIRNHNYSRLVLLESDGQTGGVLDTYDVLVGEVVSPAAAMSPPLVLPGSMSVTDALYDMQQAHVVLAVVASPAGGHLGIVTIKDLVEEIVGDIEAW